MKAIGLKARAIMSRLTGFSTPVTGLSWTPPVDERDKARRLLFFLADRRALYQPYDVEIEHHVIQSVLDIRQRLTRDLEDLTGESVLRESLLALQAACRRFLTETQDIRRSGAWRSREAILHTELGQLSALFGLHVARLAVAFDLDVEGELASILPPAPDEPADSPEPNPNDV